MSREVRTFAVTIPVTTPTTAPHTEKLTLPPRVVTAIRVRVPPGPRGEMGFAVGQADKNLLPLGTTAWIVQDDWSTDFHLETTVDSGTWWVRGYNNGQYAHTVYVTLSLTLPGAKATPRTVPIPAALISTAPPATPTAATPPATVPATPTAATLPSPATAPTTPVVQPTPTVPVTAPPSLTGTTVPAPTLPPPPSL